jgi:hypothetical protein
MVKSLKYKVGDVILWCGEKDHVGIITKVYPDDFWAKKDFDYRALSKGWYGCTMLEGSDAYNTSIIINSKLARLFYCD